MPFLTIIMVLNVHWRNEFTLKGNEYARVAVPMQKMLPRSEMLNESFSVKTRFFSMCVCLFRSFLNSHLTPNLFFDWKLQQPELSIRCLSSVCYGCLFSFLPAEAKQVMNCTFKNLLTDHSFYECNIYRQYKYLANSMACSVNRWEFSWSNLIGHTIVPLWKDQWISI